MSSSITRQEIRDALIAAIREKRERSEEGPVGLTTSEIVDLLIEEGELDPDNSETWKHEKVRVLIRKLMKTGEVRRGVKVKRKSIDGRNYNIPTYIFVSKDEIKEV